MYTKCNNSGAFTRIWHLKMTSTSELFAVNDLWMGGVSGTWMSDDFIGIPQMWLHHRWRIPKVTTWRFTNQSSMPSSSSCKVPFTVVHSESKLVCSDHFSNTLQYQIHENPFCHSWIVTSGKMERKAWRNQQAYFCNFQLQMHLRSNTSYFFKFTTWQFISQHLLPQLTMKLFVVWI